MRSGKIVDNLEQVQQRIAEAAERADRDPADVNLIAVSKTRTIDEIRAVADAGVRDFGENYAQELEEKAEALADLDLRWHAIGHLQTNKVRKIAGFVALVHSVDSPRVGREIDKRAEAAGREVPVLLQANVSGEESKFGVAEDEAFALAEELVGLDSAQLLGLMTMPPYCEDPEGNRPYFVELRTLRDRLIERGVPEMCMQHMSMGMTCDFETAVEEGATFVRVGTAIFGPRDYS
ncbi:MAG: YggS family pyridoxal phosphate-dependent enzyme [Armatimonadia bacterium]|nr:YggS family pyridoxal phosphate-dependent enzyme [Armatimonadia bacterium]